jgi:hypothetical protein
MVSQESHHAEGTIRSSPWPSHPEFPSRLLQAVLVPNSDETASNNHKISSFRWPRYPFGPSIRYALNSAMLSPHLFLMFDIQPAPLFAPLRFSQNELSPMHHRNSEGRSRSFEMLHRASTGRVRDIQSRSFLRWSSKASGS